MDFDVIDRKIEDLQEYREKYSMDFIVSILESADHLINRHGYVPSHSNIEFLTEMNITAVQAILLEEQYKKPSYNKE